MGLFSALAAALPTALALATSMGDSGRHDRVDRAFALAFSHDWNPANLNEGAEAIPMFPAPPV